MRALYEKVDTSKLYTADEAVNLVKDIATAKFVESVDVSINLGIDPKKSDQVMSAEQSFFLTEAAARYASAYSPRVRTLRLPRQPAQSSSECRSLLQRSRMA